MIVYAEPDPWKAQPKDIFRKDFNIGGPTMTSKEGFQKLENNIRENRMFHPLIGIALQNCPWIIQMGNRRLLIARRLKMEKVPMIIYSLPPLVHPRVHPKPGTYIKRIKDFEEITALFCKEGLDFPEESRRRDGVPHGLQLMKDLFRKCVDFD